MPTTEKDNCISYEANGKCQACEEEYYDSSGSCVANTIDGCVSESIEGSTHLCTGCEDGKAALANKCPGETACTGNCSHCYISNDTQLCTKCSSGYTLYGTTCKTASSGLANCWITVDGTTCIMCEGGYYDKDNVCTESSKTSTISGSGVYSLFFMGLFTFIFSF